MSVQTQIDRISTAVQNAHLKVIEKGGTSAAPYLVANLPDAINTIPEATEPTMQSKTVSPSTSAQTVKPDSGYDGLSQVTVNAMPTATQATPSISVSTAGLITATATQSAGYVAAGTKSATKQLTTQAAQTITPGTSNKIIASGRYLTGAQTIKGDANLLAENIAEGVSIFGVLGTLASGGGLPAGVSALASGSITPSMDVDYMDMTHDLGVAPNFIVWAMEEDASTSVLTNAATHGTTIIKCNKQSSSSSIVYSVHNLIGGYGSSSQAADTYNRAANNTYLTTTKARMTASTTYCFKAGKTYRWVCGVLDGIQ